MLDSRSKDVLSFTQPVADRSLGDTNSVSGLRDPAPFQVPLANGTFETIWEFLDCSQQKLPALLLLGKFGRVAVVKLCGGPDALRALRLSAGAPPQWVARGARAPHVNLAGNQSRIW